MDYTELQITSNFSFLRGASHAEEVALTAASLGHRAFAVTDRNTLAGIVRAHLAAASVGIRLVVGCRLDLQDSPSLLAYPRDRAAYGRLSRLLTLGMRRAPKGDCHLTLEDVAAHADGLVLIVVPPPSKDGLTAFDLQQLRQKLAQPLHLALSHRYRGDDLRRLTDLVRLAKYAGVSPVATNDVLYHAPDRRPLQDVMTCIRTHTTVDTAGYRLEANAERHLKAPGELARLFRFCPEAVQRTVEIADLCRFSLDELRYEYPEEVSEGGGSAQDVLTRLTWEGATVRYADGIPDGVARQLRHELGLIDKLDYAPYFLTVHDVVRFARSRDILCQGRGSAANSAVCYCLGITAVDPARTDLLFERFVSEARNEPPDIDVDFEHERREEVIQYIYDKYGRDRAGIAATVIRYRARGAIREVGKALGLSADTVGRLAGSIWGWGKEGIDLDRAREQGLDPDEPRLRMALSLARSLIGFPRHLSQHVGGFVITRGLLCDLAPIFNAAMPGRTTIEWDKDDIDALGILKVDVLALGMLTCIRKGLALLNQHYGYRYALATVPAEDTAVYDMLCRADSLGVFQVESRAQMTMLPRLKPRSFYDLVIEVAIVRPGPIQGDMVHPYLRRRAGQERVSFPSPELAQVLEKTLGVPLFQEQAMKIAIVAAGFTPDEADRLRKAMATFRHVGTIHSFQEKLIGGMVERGYERAFADRCFRQIEGFGTYGFPESHAASFALLVYVSAWLKCHHPAVFACALLNSQPMGFYAPAQIVRDAREHGVDVLPPDINYSQWDCTLEPRDHETAGRMRGEEVRLFALRLGFRQIKGLARREMETLVAARDRPFSNLDALWRRTRLSRNTLVALVDGDAFQSLGLDRRAAFWAVRSLGEQPLPLFEAHGDLAADDRPVELPEMPLGEQIVEDYASLSLSLKGHPLALLRERLQPQGVVPTASLARARNGSRTSIAGLVLVRQRPGTAKGVIFITLEDETGIANLVVLPPSFSQFRKEILAARLLLATGIVERHEGVIHVRVERLRDGSAYLELLAEDGACVVRTDSALARADEVRNPTPDQRDELVENARGRAKAFPDGRNFR